MYLWHGRGPGSLQATKSRSVSNRHPNWGHPDHDACGTGFIARLGAAPSYDIVQFALTALERLTHRGGVDADGASGDGAGVLTSLPKPFFRARAAEQGIELPELFGGSAPSRSCPREATFARSPHRRLSTKVS